MLLTGPLTTRIGLTPCRRAWWATAPSIRNTCGCNLVSRGDDDISDKIREPSLKGAYRRARRVDRGDQLGVQTSIG
jgi:hypothetical protein